MDIRKFKPSQKFIVYEESKDKYIPRLFQVVTSKVLKRYIDFLLDSTECIPSFKSKRGYELPFKFLYSQDTDIDLDSPKLELVFYNLEQLRSSPSGYRPPNSTQYFRDAIFLHDMHGYTCTAISSEFDIICWCNNNIHVKPNERNVCHRNDWMLYNDLSNNGENLYAIQIDRYDMAQDFILRNIHCQDTDEELSEIKIGANWVLTEEDIRLMNPHDLMLFYQPMQAYFMLDAFDNKVEDISFENDYNYKSLLYVWDVEDEAYIEFCNKWNNDKGFKDEIIQLVKDDNSPFTHSVSRQWRYEYVAELINVVKSKIAPLKKILTNDMFSKLIDVSEISEFANTHSDFCDNDRKLIELFYELKRYIPN